MRKYALTALVSLIITTAVAQIQDTGPGPVPSPWNYGPLLSLYYDVGGVTMGAPSGGPQGIGTINVSGGFYVNGVPISTIGSQSANLVYASPNGMAGTPTFRSIANGDLPANIAVSGTLGVTGQTSVGALLASGIVSGAGFTARFASPGPIGSTTPSTGIFTTIGGTWAGNPISLASQVSGNLPPANLAGGIGATSATFWRGDGTWATPPAGGTVTSTSWTGGIVSIANPTTMPAFTIAGTLGGVVYFPTATTWASTPALLANQLMQGGGSAGPSTFTAGGDLSFSSPNFLVTKTNGVPFGALATQNTVDLSAQAINNLAISHLNSGTSASSTTFWRGDGTWATPSGGTGTVTSTSWTGGIVSISNPTTTPSFTIAGTSGGIPYFSGAATWASSGALSANQIVLGGGAGAAPIPLGSLGTTTTVLHGNAAGAPTFAAVALATDVSGNLPTTNLNSGTSASATTFWRGDGTWATPSGSGATVTSVAETFNGGLIAVAGSPITTSGTLALTVAGTSGGVPYFNSSSTWLSSAALTNGSLMQGGGAGAAPATFTLGGDCTFSTPNITCTKTNGVAFGALATANPATPPAIGATTAAAGTFTPLTSNNIISTEFPGLTTNVEAVGTPGLDGANWFIFNAPALTSGTEASPTLRVDRSPTGTGGSNANVTNAIWGNASIPANDSNDEWIISGQLQNRSLATTGSQNVAVAGSAFKQGASQVGGTWATYGQCVDQTGVAAPIGSCIAGEFDVGVPGATNGGADTNKQRVGLQVGYAGASGTHIAYGMLVGGPTGLVNDTFIELAGPGTYGIGINAADAGIFGTAVVLMAGSSQQGIAWENASNSYVGSSAGSVFFKGSDNVNYFDNYDSATFAFRNSGGVGLKIVGGHAGATTAAPAPTSCGGGSPTVTGTDLAMTITEGTTATGCTVTFNSVFNAAPRCTVSSPAGNTFTSYSTTTSALTIVNPSASGDVFMAICVGV